MAYDLENRLVIGVASSAVFDLAESDGVFRKEGEQKYRLFQAANIKNPLPRGVAFPFIKRLLSLNDLRTETNNPLIEVLLLSKNDPDTGLRVMKTIEHYNLNITRAIFMQGKSPYEYIPALNIALFLSAHKPDIEAAIKAGYPAGHVLASNSADQGDDKTLRIAFDFDGVVVNDEAEAVFQADGLMTFNEHEIKHVLEPHSPGPLHRFLVQMAEIQRLEEAFKINEPSYKNRVRISIVTSRNAPAHERALNTLKGWGVLVNDAFFLGGIEKAKVLKILQPHIFFDDQAGHLSLASAVVPSVHIPFGVRNQNRVNPSS